MWPSYCAFVVFSSTKGTLFFFFSQKSLQGFTDFHSLSFLLSVRSRRTESSRASSSISLLFFKSSSSLSVVFFFFFTGFFWTGMAQKKGSRVSEDAEVLPEVPLQAVLLADSFAQKFRPITLERPKVRKSH